MKNIFEPKVKNPFEPAEKLGKKVNLDSSEYETSAEETSAQDFERPKITGLVFLVFLILGIFLLRLIILQIKEGYANRFLAEGNRMKSQDIISPRGGILASDGVALVKNKPDYLFQVLPFDLPKDKNAREEIYQKAASILEKPIEEIENAVEPKRGSLEPVVLTKGIEKEKALVWQSEIAEISALEITAIPEREYISSPGFAHLLGYTGKISQEELDTNPSYPLTSITGKAGIEKIYEEFLKGKPGEQQIEVDAKGRLQRVLQSVEPVVGDTLELNIDAGLTQVLAQNLQAEIQQTGGKGGSAIALNPKTGAVLSLVSLPQYGNNALSQGMSKEEAEKLLADKNNPLFNRAIQGTYPPGSSIKPFIASAALQEKVVTPNFAFDTPPEIKIGDFVFPDWKDHGMTDIRRAIAESNNVFFYTLGGGYDKIKGLGIKLLSDYLKKFNFDSKTGIDLPSEGAGFVPTADWKQKTKGQSWYLGDTYHMSIGQGDLLVTPLEEAVSAAAIANGGEVLEPHLVNKILDPSGKVVEEIKKKVIKSGFISPDNLKVVQEGMRLTITGGSAQSLKDLPIAVAGKTGTAQIAGNDKTHAWFTGYAPYDDPQIVITVMIEQGGEGYATAAPVAKEAFRWWAENRMSH